MHYIQIPEKQVNFALFSTVQIKRTNWKAKVVERNIALRILIKILKVNYNIQWTHPVHAYTHTHTHRDTHKHNTRDMILLSILSNADESFGDNSDLDLLWEKS